MKKRILVAVLLPIMVAAAYGWHLYTKPPADTRQQSADWQVTADELISAYKQDEAAADRKFADKILVVSGTVAHVDTSVAEATVYLGTNDPLSSIICSFYAEETKAVKNIRPGTAVLIKGKCTGILSDVILNKCSMIK